MMDPAEKSDPLHLYSGEVYLTVCVTVEKLEAESIAVLEEKVKSAVQDQLIPEPPARSISVTLEDSDVMCVNRTPDFWDIVDMKYDQKKDGK